ncbi:hypothetical protein BDZ94DRAFT_1326123 [Collybia nuda]|uniref:BTB domain-containing protein n=1 Tax=Collybia nuda TaxID=64659 RepID=A0A9P6CE47_9AGAR|nr:hypothetical protein BDZ94DRAFT_1326123 [Collybia nuda]
MSDTSGSMINVVTVASPLHSERFSSLDADLKIQSADGVLFQLHKKYLETTTGGFSQTGLNSQGEIVQLPETSATLELLFQFIYPTRHPGLASTPFETLAPLAEAAEKYEVFAAMNVCQIRMMNMLPNYAEEIMAYAVKHDYLDIMYSAAPLLLEKPLESVLAEFPPAIAIAWTRYHATWSTCVRSAMLSLPKTFQDGGYSHRKQTREWQEYEGCYCGQPIDSTINKLLMELAKGITSLRDLSWMDRSDLVCCERLKPALAQWRISIESFIQGIPDLSTFV